MKRKILAIEDSATMREFIERTLTGQSADYHIVLAKDGTEGLTYAASEQPDLILLDFGLPDLKGDEVCRRLRADKYTAGLPVLLMSSSSADTKRTLGEFENVIEAIAKPFTPEMLCSTVANSLREIGSKIPATPNAATPKPVRSVLDTQAAATMSSPGAVRAEVKFSGDTGQFSLISVLRAVEQDQLTGRLRLTNNANKPVELYVVSGRPMLVTMHDPALYLRNSGHKLTSEQIQIAGRLGQEQTQTGTPMYLQFAQAKLMSWDEASALCRQQDFRLFAPLWSAPRVHFDFEPNVPLPPLTSSLPPYEGNMNAWAMESLRLAGPEFRTAGAGGEPTGIPAYTRKGYERIQQIPLNPEELAFAASVGPAQSLEKISAAMNTDVTQAQRILQRFVSLEIFDYWPASLLQAD